MKKRNINSRTLESWMMANGKSGQSFISARADKDITAIAAHHNRKVKTERMVAVSSSKKGVIAFQIVRVTLL